MAPARADTPVAPASEKPAASRRWADLRTRVISALVIGPASIAGLLWGGWIWDAVVLLAAAIVASEWAGMFRPPVRMLGWPGAAVTASALAAVALAALELPGLALAVVAAGCVVAAMGRVWTGGISFALGALYMGIPGIALIWLRQQEGALALLFLVLLVCASDVGAYAVGRMLGGPKLAPTVSPSKTWAGAAGGLAAAVAMGCGVALAAGHGGVAEAGALAAALAIVAQAGDLMESGLKRRMGVKDSGRLLPGHGGLLDRLDGLMAAAPVLALTALFIQGGALFWR